MGGVAEGPAPRPGFALIQDGKGWLRFEAPERIVAASTPAEVPLALRELEQAASHGLWAVGFLAYEAAAAFGLAVHPPLPGLPLLWFGLYQSPCADAAPVPAAIPGPVGPWEPALDASLHAGVIALL
ncbi:MAG TPA: aminodeoxychorismate synthase, component I, partial [Vicinamibacteria bacterium]